MLSKVELMTAMPRAGGIYYFLDRSLGSALGTIGVSNTFLEETKLGVTPMARGVALPHMRLHGPNAPHILPFARPRRGDGERRGPPARRRPGSAGRARARSLVVSPEDEPRQHLRLMARLAERIEDEAFLNAWPRPVRLTI
jgi:amino acid transporter